MMTVKIRKAVAQLQHVLFAWFILFSLEAWAEQPLILGVLNQISETQTVTRWQPLASYLSASIGRQVVLKSYSFAELEVAVSAHKVDLVFSNPGHYILLQSRYDLSAPIATLISGASNGKEVDHYGGVIFTRANNVAIDRLEQVSGKTIAVYDKDSLGSFQIEAFEFLDAGMPLNRNSNSITEASSQDQIIERVLAGKADVGFVRTGILESLASKGQLDLARIKVIQRRQDAGFPYLHSTRLYPEWPLGVMPDVDVHTARRIAVALLSLDPGNTTAKAIGIHGFTFAADYNGVEEMLRQMRLPPFEQAPKVTLADLWHQFAYWIIAVGVLFQLLLIATVLLILQFRRVSQSQNTLSTILENVSAHIYLKDTRGHYLFANRPVRELWGKSIDEIVDLGDEAFFDAESAALIRETDQRVIANGEIVRGEETNTVAATGCRTTFWTVKLPLRNSAGEINGLCGISTDISERKQIEENITQALSLLQATLDSTADGILTADGKGHIVSFNRRFVELWNIPRDIAARGDEDKALGHAVAQLRDPAGFMAKVRELYDSPETESFDTLEFADGRVFERYSIPQRINNLTVGRVWSFRDITARVKAEQSLRRSQEEISAQRRLFHGLLDNAPLGIWMVTPLGKVEFVNKTFCAVTGVSESQFKSADHYAHVLPGPPEVAASCMRSDQECLDQDGGHHISAEWLPFVDGKDHLLEITKVKINNEDGSILGVMAIAADVTRRQEAEARLQLAASVFENAREGIIITDVNANIVEVNETFLSITGYSRDEVIGENPRMFHSGFQSPDFYDAMWRALKENGFWVGELWNRRKDGRIYAELISISAVHDAHGRVQNFVALFTDITAIKEHQRQLEHIAHYDVLTNLPNRVLLADRLTQSMAQAQRRSRSLAVAFLDLDGFKIINDRHGHQVGDQLLIAIAGRLKAALREGDTLARIGGDEFVALLVDVERPDDCIMALERLLEAAADPITIDTQTLTVSASIGMTMYPIDNVSADQLLRHADNAMYIAKQAGKNRYHLFDVEEDEAIKNKRETMLHIRRALSHREFVLHYQPKVNMKTGAIIGVEALIRWQHPEQGLLAPAAFLPIIDSHPLSQEVGEWVIETALEQLSQWHAMNLDIPVSVNIGAHQLQQEDFVESLRERLNAFPDVRPEWLELEVLESSALADIGHVSKVMRACIGMGVNFALDDFGTGYSSLTYLKRLPATLLKIDQSFVRDMLDDREDLAIIEGVVSLAAAFHRRVIAEGVETIAHGELLILMGCDYGQGYAIARPMPAADIPAWIDQWRPDATWTQWQHQPASRDVHPLLSAEVTHRAWVSEIEKHLQGDRLTPPPLDQHHCAFSEWYDVEGQRRYGDRPEFAEVADLHQRIHALGQLLVEHFNRGQFQVIDRQLHELRDASRELVSRLRQLMRDPNNPLR